MTDRTVAVKLSLQVSQYLDGMEKARKKTAETGTEAEKLTQKKDAFDLLGRTALTMGAGIAAGVALAIAKYAEFDQAMSNVQAATHASAADQKLLGDAAIAAGASTVFSATESANAIEELSKAGLSTADILGGALAGSLDLASAGQLGVARAAEIASTTLQQFKLDGNQAGHVADVLAAGAGKAMGSVEDLANGLKFVGPVANSMGISLEETTGVLALFAQQGIIGEQAGTGLRGVLSSLTAPSKQAALEIEGLGLKLYDSEGKFLGMQNAAEQLNGAYGTMNDEARNASMGIIFGRETITAATTLYQAGAKGVAEWTDAVDDSGYASETARARLDNLKGDVEALGGAFDTALISSGAAGNDVLRNMTQSLTNLLDLYNDAPEPVKAAALATGVLAASALLAGGAFFLGAPKAAQFNAAIATMGPNAQKAGAALTASAGPIGLAFAAAGIAIALFAGQQAEAKARTQAFSDTLDKQTGKLTDSTRELAVAGLATKDSFLWMESDSAYDAAKKLGIGLDLVTEAALGNGPAMEELNVALKVGENGSAKLAEQMDKTGLSAYEYGIAADAVNLAVSGTSGSLEEAIRVTQQKSSVDEEAQLAAEGQTAALESLKGKSDETNTSIEDLAETIRGFGSASLSARDASRNYEEAIDALTASVVENGTSLDIAEASGRANQAALDALAKASLETAAATYEQTGSQEQANAEIARGREELIKQLGQFGITGDAANAYADELGLIPGNVDTAVNVHADEAKAKIDEFVRKLNNIPGYREVVINQVVKQTGAAHGQVGAAYNAEGGTIVGPGTGTSDSILSWVSNGEEITRAIMAEKHRPLLKAINADRVDEYFRSAPRHATGGTVGYRTPVQYASPAGYSNSITTITGDTLQATFQLAPLPGRPISEQVFEAARRMKIRRNS